MMITSLGDIGETAETVEERLENHFQLAHHWGCVLLLDEAELVYPGFFLVSD